MKYLKLYEDLLADEVARTINYDLISDAKEMSIEYLDIGMDLYIDVFALSMHGEWLRMLYYEYNHTTDLQEWYRIDQDLFSSPVKIGYELQLTKLIDASNLLTSNDCYNGENECIVACKELYDSMKIIYTNEVFLRDPNEKK